MTIHKAALYALCQHAVVSLGGSRGMPGVNLMTPSVPQSTSPDTVIKHKELDSLYVQMIEKFIMLSQSVAVMTMQLQ